MPFTPSSFETQARLSALLRTSRDQQTRNLDQLRRNIAEAESPGEGPQPRPQPQSSRTTTVDEDVAAARERQRLAQVRLTLPIPGRTKDYGASVLDRVAARYAALRRK